MFSAASRKSRLIGAVPNSFRRSCVWTTRHLSSKPSGGELEEYSSEILDEDGEWAGCSRKFMAPLRIAARGPGKKRKHHESGRIHGVIFICVLFLTQHLFSWEDLE
jgi:hypothetical protein